MLPYSIAGKELFLYFLHSMHPSMFRVFNSIKQACMIDKQGSVGGGPSRVHGAGSTDHYV